MADRIIIEINESVPLAFKGIHDIKVQKAVPHREILPITSCDSRVGDPFIKIDPNKVEAIVFTQKPDAPATIAAPDKKTISIAEHLMKFFEDEVEAGRLGKSLLPLQAGIGKIANAVLAGFLNSPFENLSMYSEIFSSTYCWLPTMAQSSTDESLSLTRVADSLSRLSLTFRSSTESSVTKTVLIIGVVKISSCPASLAC